MKLKKIAKVQGGYAFKSDSFVSNETPVIRIGNIVNNKVVIDNDITAPMSTIGDRKEFLIFKDDLLIAMSGATVGKVGIYSFDNPSMLNQRVGNIKCDEKYKKYVFYLLQSPQFKKYVELSSIGCAQPNISNSQIENFEFKENSIDEIENIVRKLDNVSSLINIKKNEIEKSNVLVKSQFVEMFKGKNTPAYTKKIEELCSEMMIGPFGSALHKDEISTSGDVFVLGTDNVVENFFSKKEIRYIDNNKYQQLKKYTVKPDDIIISMMGTIGRTAIIPNDLEPAIISSHLCCLTPDKSKIYPDFLQKEFVLDDEVLYQIHSNKKGAIMSGLNLGIIKNITIHYPDLNKQKEFLNIVKQIDKQKFEFEKQLKKLEELKASLMQEYFG